MSAVPKKVQAARDWFREGETYTVVEQERRPELIGTKRTITRLGKTTADGGSFRMSLPTRAKDVVAITPDVITYRFDGEHRITLRRSPAPETPGGNRG